MTGIGSINGVSGAAPLGAAALDPARAATGAIGEIGHRVLAWVGASGGSGDRAGWSAASGTTSDFSPDARELARGGDVYGLGEIGGALADRFGGTPAEQGALRRSLESFTREAVVQLAGLSGAGSDRQLAGLGDALDAAAGLGASGGLDGIAQRLDAAAAVLARQNNG